MVDAMVNGVEDYLIEGLSFKLQPGASYVTDRRSVSYFPAGSNVYVAQTGTRVIRINLTGEGWLDPSTVRLMMTVRNTAGAGRNLVPLSGAWSFFRRVRCLVGGSIVDDVDYYNRVHEMLHILTSKMNRDNDDIEGFGCRWDGDNNYASELVNQANYLGIPTGQAKTASFKPLCGLFNQPKLIPLMWCPLTLEFEVVSLATDPVLQAAAGDHGEGTWNANNVSSSWQLEDVQIKCDLVTLDSALQNSYAEHVLSGKALPINYSTYVTQFQTLANGLPMIVNVTRSVSRLKSLFFNFDGNRPALANGNRTTYYNKDWNTFSHPMQGAYSFNNELQLSVQIGSKLFPEYPIRSAAEAYYQLKKALGIHGSAFQSISPTFIQYIRDHFIVGIDTEKILDAGFTGLNTRAGDLMVVRAQGANGNLQNADSNTYANKLYIILHNDQILEIRDVGTQVFD